MCKQSDIVSIDPVEFTDPFPQSFSTTTSFIALIHFSVTFFRQKCLDSLFVVFLRKNALSSYRKIVIRFDADIVVWAEIVNELQQLKEMWIHAALFYFLFKKKNNEKWNWTFNEFKKTYNSGESSLVCTVSSFIPVLIVYEPNSFFHTEINEVRIVRT